MANDPHWGMEMALSAVDPHRYTNSPAGSMAGHITRSLQESRVGFVRPLTTEVRAPVSTGRPAERGSSVGTWMIALFIVMAVIGAGRDDR